MIKTAAMSNKAVIFMRSPMPMCKTIYESFAHGSMLLRRRMGRAASGGEGHSPT